MARPIFTGGSGFAAIAAALVVILVVAAVAGGAYLTGWRLSYQPAMASCLVDDAIDSGTRRDLDRVALNFVNIVTGINPVSAYGMLSADAKGAVSPDRFLAALRPSLEPVEPIQGAHVAHTYFVRGPAHGAIQRVICGTLDQPDHWVAVTARPIPEQAHLIVEAAAKGGRWAFVLWLVHDADWHVQGFNFAATAMAGKSAAQIRAMARAEHDRHHDFNALLLYGAAARLAARGTDLQLGIEPAIRQEMAKLTVPALLQGKPPLSWKFGDDAFQILNVGAAGAGDKMYLAITHRITPWTGDEAANQRNRALIADLVKTLPEYAGAFAGLIVVARDEGGTHLYRTVAQNQAEAEAVTK